MNIMSFYVKVENEGSKESNLTMKMLKKRLKDETMEWYRLRPNLHFYVAKDEDKYASATVTNNFRSTQK